MTGVKEANQYSQDRSSYPRSYQNTLLASPFVEYSQISAHQVPILISVSAGLFPRRCWHKFSTCVLPKSLTSQPNYPWSMSCISSHLSWILSNVLPLEWFLFTIVFEGRLGRGHSATTTHFSNGDCLMQDHLYNPSPWSSSSVDWP